MKPPLRMLNLLPSFPPVPPHVIRQPVERRERGDPEGAGGQESGDGERDGERGGDYDGAEEDEERGGDGEGDESADEGEAREAEEEGAEGRSGEVVVVFVALHAVIAGVGEVRWVLGIAVGVLGHGGGGEGGAVGGGWVVRNENICMRDGSDDEYKEKGKRTRGGLETLV
nr:hypothetical protein Saspl_029611 [Ipomoea batatas]GME13243.1 hypothetical protein Saspl_029611 [Ipomoea batatas]